MNTQKVALVTGASSGIGAATVERLLKDGLVVYAAARRVEKMAELEKNGAHIIKMDITKDEDIRNAVKTIADAHGAVDILVNNAGFGMYGAVEDTTLDDARYQFDVNIFGLARLTQLVLPGMRARKSGKIINISSMGGRIYTTLGAWYHATKHALEGWSDCLRLELAPFDIDVVVVQPGIIKTAFGDVMTGPMMERSGATAYADLAKKIEKSTKDAYEKGMGSPADVIANVISKAIRSSRPKTRYVAGQFARPLMFMRKWFGDRIFDKVITSAV